LIINHLSSRCGIQLKSHWWCNSCKYLPEYSLAECGADGCNRFSISRSLVVRFLVWRNRNSVQTIAMTATHSVDLRWKEKMNYYSKRSKVFLSIKEYCCNNIFHELLLLLLLWVHHPQNRKPLLLPRHHQWCQIISRLEWNRGIKIYYDIKRARHIRYNAKL
jgi:hypothetical protein